MTSGALTLAAISAGAVFMGANSYIGNAPNFMVYAIAAKGGVKMPSFFGYLLWSSFILIPTFLLISLLFFRLLAPVRQHGASLPVSRPPLRAWTHKEVGICKGL